MEHRRPFVTWKLATTLDGRSAAADGTSRWVTSRAARVDSHRLRAQCDVILVGTGTVETDDPELTVRDEYDEPLPHQPLRAVMGLRELDPQRRVFNDRAATVRLETRDPAAALALLHDAGPAARVPRGRTAPGGRVPARGPRRRGRRLCGAGVPRCGRERRGRPRHHHHRGREADADHRRDHRRHRCGGRRADHDGTATSAPSSPAQRPTTRGTDMFTGIVEELGTVEALEDQGRRGPAHRARAAGHQRRRAGRLDLGQRLLPDGGRRDRRTRRGVHRRRDARDAGQDLARCARARRAGQPRARGHARPPGSAATSSRATSTPPAPWCGVRRASTGSSSRSPCPPTSSATWCRRARSPSTGSP